MNHGIFWVFPIETEIETEFFFTETKTLPTETETKSLLSVESLKMTNSKRYKSIILK
jgi:hypothetical protein